MVNPMAQPADPGEALIQAVDHGLLVFGEIVRTAIYERIERSYQIRREEIPEKVEIFHDALQDLLGTSAKVMERLIAKDFCSRLGLNFAENENWTLVDYVSYARRVRRNV